MIIGLLKFSRLALPPACARLPIALSRPCRKPSSASSSSAARVVIRFSCPRSLCIIDVGGVGAAARRRELSAIGWASSRRSGGGGGGGPAGTGCVADSFLACRLGDPLPWLELLGGAHNRRSLVSSPPSQVGDDWIWFGHAQLTLRLNGDQRPPQDRGMKNNGYDQPELQWASLPQPSDSVTSETLLKPPCLMRPMTRMTVP